MGDALVASGPLHIPWGIDFFSIIVGVVTGALFACNRKLDIVGTVASGLLTAYGGGIMRDLLLQDEGVYFMQHPNVILICIVFALFVFLFRGLFKHLSRTLFVADALSMALFALAGVNKAFSCGQGFVMAVMLGVITAVGGGTLRDACTGETPSVFKPSNFYALASLGGSLAFALVAFTGLPLVMAALACVLVAVALRFVSVRRNWKTPGDVDLAPRVSAQVRKVSRRVKDLIDRRR